MNQPAAAQSSAGLSFHQLTVKTVCSETSEAKSFVLVPERGETALYRYLPGQFLTFRIPHGSGEITRSYSLSSAPGMDADMTVCVKRVTGGLGSNWFNDHLIAGARIAATQPAGRFILRDRRAPLLLIAGGSGITPCLSLIKQALDETGRRVKLVYANQTDSSVIYRETLASLASRFADRFECQHWIDTVQGFLRAGDIHSEAKGWETADCYVCGPEPLMNLAEETLQDMLGDKATILTERFVSPDVAPEERPTAANTTHSPTDITIDDFKLTLDGGHHSVPFSSGMTLLDAALAAGIDAPCSCVEGHCGTCMSQLKSGEVSMASTRGLSKRNIARGRILACQARPCSADPLWIDFDL